MQAAILSLITLAIFAVCHNQVAKSKYILIKLRKNDPDGKVTLMKIQ